MCSKIYAQTAAGCFKRLDEYYTHQILKVLTLFLANAKLAVTGLKEWTFQGVYTGMLAVDSFFVISGLLVSYLFLKQCKKNQGKWCLQMVLYYVHRLIRYVYAESGA